MKIIFTLFTILIFHTTAFAQELTCLDKLLPFNRHSGLHQINRDEWTDGKEVMDSDSAKNAMNFLVNSKLLCKPIEVVIKIAPICAPVIADLMQSNTCFIFTNVGYFIVSRDGGRNSNFIFSKDKRFADPK